MMLLFNPIVGPIRVNRKELDGPRFYFPRPAKRNSKS